MFEKVNPSHPDKIADRIAGALVDIAYGLDDDPRIAVEVLIGHGVCHIIAETSVSLPKQDVGKAVARIAGDIMLDYREVPQDSHLADNQRSMIRCGDNGIFKGVPVTREQADLTGFARILYREYPTDGKFILDGGKLIICQSNADGDELRKRADTVHAENVVVNPLGDWTGGTDVDTGATNRKLGSDMGDAVTGGGINGKDLSKADVSVNIYAHLKAQATGETVMYSCAIGDEEIDGMPYCEIVDAARNYVKLLGGFEKLAEWGLIR